MGKKNYSFHFKKNVIILIICIFIVASMGQNVNHWAVGYYFR